MELLQDVDNWLFRLLNSGVANPVFDVIFPIITDSRIFVWVVVPLLIILGIRGGRKAWLCIGLALLTFAVCDAVNSRLLKELFGRIRPCHTLQDVHLLVHCGAGKSFPSTHASNMGGLAVIFAAFYPSARYYVAAYAGLVAYSRVYCGVHYPFDVLAGLLFGVAVAVLVLSLWKILAKRMAFLRVPDTPPETTG